MNKAEFKREYRTWRTFLRGQGYMYHGDFEQTEASMMAHKLYWDNAPKQVKYALEKNKHCIYLPLTKGNSRIQAKLNMRLPASFRR